MAHLKKTRGHLTKLSYGHLSNGCKDLSGGQYYQLVPNCLQVNCDGSSDICHNGQPFAVCIDTDLSEYLGKVISYLGGCYTVDTIPTSDCIVGIISVNKDLVTVYDACSDCCSSDACSLCGGCEYHEDSTLSVQLQHEYIFYWHDGECASADSDTICAGFRLGPAEFTWLSCSETGVIWQNVGTPRSFYDCREEEGWCPGCSKEWESAGSNQNYQIRKNCVTGGWERLLVGSPLGWEPLDKVCRGGVGNPPEFGNLGTGCDGGISQETACCDDINDSKYTTTDSYITLNNNNCGLAP